MNLTIGERLKDLRKEHKLTSVQLEKQTKINKSTLCELEQIGDNETKDKRYDYRYFIKLADYYDVSVDYLLGRSEAKKPETNLGKAVNYTHLSAEVVEYLHNNDLYLDQVACDLMIKALINNIDSFTDYIYLPDVNRSVVFADSYSLTPWEKYRVVRVESQRTVGERTVDVINYNLHPKTDGITYSTPKWWNAYNKVKHKRLTIENEELNYKKANLLNLSNSFSARIKIVHFKQTNDMSRKPSARNERSEWRALGFGA